MKKTTSAAFGKNVYLIGKDSEGTNYWLEAGKWDCNWYWGFGYVETYTRNNDPSASKDIKSHQHFDGLFLNHSRKNGFDAFKEFFAETTLTEKETRTLIELMKSYYSAREYSDMIHRGGAHYTTNPVSEIIKNDSEYDRINKTVIPAIMNAVYELLSPKA